LIRMSRTWRKMAVSVEIEELSLLRCTKKTTKEEGDPLMSSQIWDEEGPDRIKSKRTMMEYDSGDLKKKAWGPGDRLLPKGKARAPLISHSKGDKALGSGVQKEGKLLTEHLRL